MGAVHRAVCSHCHANRGLSLAHSLAWAWRPTLSLPLPLKPICSLPATCSSCTCCSRTVTLFMCPTRREHLTRGREHLARWTHRTHASWVAAHRARRESEGLVGCGHIAFVSQAIHPRREVVTCATIASTALALRVATASAEHARLAAVTTSRADRADRLARRDSSHPQRQ